MMLVPRRTSSFDLFDDFFRDDDFITRKQPNLMKTDIIEKPDKYIIEVDLPGCEKENINLSLNDGYLEISSKIERTNDNSEDEKYIRKERYYGECTRSFYVGDSLDKEDISAEFKNGILTVEVPKKEEKKETPESRRIEIK